MRTERESATRLLQLMMIASLVLPAALFVYASWNDYRDIHAVTDERITRSLDVLQEQALKVFETVDRTFAEVDEVVRGMSDDQIRASQLELHQRLERIARRRARWDRSGPTPIFRPAIISRPRPNTMPVPM
jgi:two-component system, NtrC family, sensor kinase